MADESGMIMRVGLCQSMPVIELGHSLLVNGRLALVAMRTNDGGWFAQAAKCSLHMFHLFIEEVLQIFAYMHRA